MGRCSRRTAFDANLEPTDDQPPELSAWVSLLRLASHEPRRISGHRIGDILLSEYQIFHLGTQTGGVSGDA